jgi:uncharacterized repeat protein (TIGR03843 family)
MKLQPSKKFITQALLNGELSMQGQFLHGSNYTYLGEVQCDDQVLPVVYKPTKGEQPLWDFPTGTLSRREVAAFLVSEALGWELVPPTVYRREGPIGPGSVQLFIQHDPEYHYFNFKEEDRQRLRPMALFDLIVNNADRKGGHILVDEDRHLWLIDHGVCFHQEEKLRTVVWDFAGEPIPADLSAAMASLARQLEIPAGRLPRLLHNLLSFSEIRALEQRTRRLVKAGVFPQPASNRRPYPWPPV